MSRSRHGARHARLRFAEQVRGDVGHLDRRTDIYSLGATMYWFLTDRAPYEGGYPEVLAGIMEREPIPPHRIRPDIPVDLETITLKCLEKEPARRYPNARAVSEDLRRFLAGEPITARPATFGYKLGKRIRKNPGLTAATAAVLVAFAAVVGYSARANFQAQRQAAIAQELLVQANEIDELVRITAMMPLHDRRAAEARIGRRLSQIEERTSRLGRLGFGPGHYAIGRGYLASSATRRRSATSRSPRSRATARRGGAQPRPGARQALRGGPAARQPVRRRGRPRRLPPRHRVALP